MLHPDNLGEVVHLDVLFRPLVKFGIPIVILVTGNLSRRPSDRA